MATPAKHELYRENPKLALVEKLSIAQSRIERSFLDGGNALVSVMDAVSGLTRILDGLVTLLDPQIMSRVSDGMREVGKDLKDLPSLACRKQDAFIQINSIADSVHGRVEEMREIIRYLRTIAVTVKITGAGIPEFSGFAEEIRERIQTVSEEIARFGEQLIAMRTRLGGATESSQGVIRDFSSAIPVLVGSMDRGAAALAEQQKRMTATANQLKQITGTIQAKVGSVLSALQVGDVTRQRIEHVMSMLESYETFKASPDARALDEATLLAFEQALAAMAHAQLIESVDDLNEKAANIASTIASFSIDANKVLSLRDELAGESSTDGKSVLDQMKFDLAQASDLSSRVADRILDLDHVVATVDESTQALIGGIASIRKIKLDIFYMALNSNLACTRLGEAGRSVNVASGELRVYADRLEGPAEGIVRQMREIEDAKNQLTAGEVFDVEGIGMPLTQAKAAVDTVADGIGAGLAQLSSEGDSVFQAIEKAVRTLDFRSDLGDVLEECLDMAASGSHQIAPAISAGCEAIDRLSSAIFSTYTMSQERDIHLRYLPVAAATEPVAISSGPRDDEDLFEDALF